MEKFISETLVSARTGEPLEQELKKKGELSKQLLKLRDALDLLEQEQVSMTVCEQVRNAWIEYGNIYAKEAYRLGVKDGIGIGKEQKAGREKTIISYQDMVSLIKIYDAVKKLNMTLFGELAVHSEEEGVLGAIELVYYIIEHGLCEEIRLLGDDEVSELLADVLDDNSLTEGERAKRLLGITDI